MEKRFNPWKLYGALAAGMAAFGFAPILVRFAPEASAILIATWRTLFASLILLPYWWIQRQPIAEAFFNKEIMQMAFSGICLGLHFICWVASLYYTSVASASVLVTIHPVLVILVERLWFKRSFARTAWIGVAFAFGGAVLLGIADSRIEQSFSNPLLGNLLALTAAVIFVIYLFIGQKIRQKREWIDYLFPVYTYAALTCLAVTFILGEELFSVTAAGFWAGFGLAVGPQIVGHGSANYAVKYISPTLISTLILVEPVLATILAFLIFGELPPLLSLGAMGLILIGIGLTWKRDPKKSVDAGY